MNVVLRYFHRVDFNVMPVSDLQKQFPYPVLNISKEDPFWILRCLHQMILGVVNGMAGSSRGWVPELLNQLSG